jgi:phosphoribosyl 1,2-cyclic phosphodiesterase
VHTHIDPSGEETMDITFWGTRGSVPVSGAQHARHGGATTCIEIEIADERVEYDRVIIDCGTGVVDLGREMGAVESRALLLQTHMHWDHVQGFPFFAPLFSGEARLDFWSVDRDGRSLRDVLDEQMSQPTFPIGLADLPAGLRFDQLPAAGSRSVGPLQVRWAEMSHPSGSTAWRLDHNSSSVVFSGDVEVSDGSGDELTDFADGADVLIMDAQYTDAEYAERRGWGHSTARQAVDVAVAAGVDHLILTHHDPTHDDSALDAKQNRARRYADGRVIVDNAHDRLQITVGKDRPWTRTNYSSR